MSQSLLSLAEHAVPRFLELLRALVERESPSGEVERIREVAALLAVELERRGARVERIPVPGAGEHVLARLAGRGEEARPLLVLGHMDTVHPVGSLERMPFRVAGGRVTGPGAYDMKCGLAATVLALDLLAERGEAPRGDLVILFTCDEEVGSHTSRTLIEALAREARAALVIEPPLSGGGAKTARKGVATYTLSVRGRAAHAGIEPQRGASAVHELARQIARVLELADTQAGTTVNVGVIAGGTASNVVAESATASIDVRFWTRREAERVDRALLALEPLDQRCRLEVTGGVNRGPLERTPESAALFERARALAGALGFDLAEGGTGGGSDGNLTAAQGCPTLDGLGVDGGGAHSPNEHILLADVPRRMALLSRLFAEL